MELIIVNAGPCDASLGLSDALIQLSESPVEAGTVCCLGIRLEGFSVAAWQTMRTWLVGLVSGSELVSASRFLHVEDAVRHLLARSLLRSVLTYQGVSALPDAWPVNAWGKPDGVAWNVHFNLSHAGSEIWLACCREAAVGIDVEEDCPELSDLLPLLHPAEAGGLSDDADRLRRRRLWVRKEAVIKATGKGLSLPLADFQVALDDRAAAWLLQPPQEYPAPWTTMDLPVPGSTAVALAVRGQDVVVRWRLARVRA
jgi:4'-phosphopantetheinyl transferase